MSNLGILLLFANVLKNSLIIFFIFFIQLFGDDIDQQYYCQEMDLIELFKRSFARSER